jgi:hypothetical protein
MNSVAMATKLERVRDMILPYKAAPVRRRMEASRSRAACR